MPDFLVVTRPDNETETLHPLHIESMRASERLRTAANTIVRLVSGREIGVMEGYESLVGDWLDLAREWKRWDSNG